MKVRFVTAGLAVLAIVVVVSGWGPGGRILEAQQSTDFSSVETQRQFVNQYCAGCHSDRVQSGGFSWTTVDLEHPDRHAEQVESAIRKLRSGMMPPPGARRPEADRLTAFAAVLESGVDAGSLPYAKAPDLYRLNRTQYRNTVRDLLDLDVDVSSLLPPDGMSGGFDNISDALSVTPTLVQGYVRAAGRVSREAVGDTDITASMKMYTVPKVVNQTRRVEGAPFGTRGGTSVVHNFPVDGDYTFRVNLYHDYLEELFGRNLPPNIRNQELEVSIDGARVALFAIDPEMRETETILISEPIRVLAGPRRVTAAFIANFDGPTEDQLRQVEQTMVDVSAGIPGLIALPHLQSLVIAGPLTVAGVTETPSRRKIFSCTPASAQEELSCAEKILSMLARQAYRRPITAADVEFLKTYYHQGREEGHFEEGIRMALQAILVHPEFLFRFEQTPAGATAGEIHRISDLELASRLSYFLWSGPPDEQLLSVAERGELAKPDVLNSQVRRMLSDGRAAALADNFASQWLRLQTVQQAAPDTALFPNFTRNLGQSMTRETQLLFDSIMREDRSITDLLTADWTFVDEVLAKHYGIPNVLGTRFRRVPVTDTQRYGLIGHASVLTQTSLANRTSPVKRGEWIMEVLIGSPPPPPPPSVPPLAENLLNERPLSVRERMEQHRANPACSSCHRLMDPIGLALENFDAIGQWRINDAGLPIDPSAEMYDGTRLDGPIGLRQAILKRSDAFITNFAENLLAYGLGRTLDYRDMQTVRGIVREAAKNDNRFSSFVLAVVHSAPFQMREAEHTLDDADRLRGR